MQLQRYQITASYANDDQILASCIQWCLEYKGVFGAKGVFGTERSICNRKEYLEQRSIIACPNEKTENIASFETLR